MLFLFADMFFCTCWPQFGEQAGQMLLDSVLDGLQIENQGGLFVVDVNAGVGNLFDGFISKRGTSNYNMQYVAVMSDAMSAEWFQHAKVPSNKYNSMISFSLIEDGECSAFWVKCPYFLST